MMERWHGTPGGYTNHKCRCLECRAAWAADVLEDRTRRRSAPVPERVHGSSNGYHNYGCRCQPCKDAWAAECRERTARKRAATQATT